jgi:hypothetical protein
MEDTTAKPDNAPIATRTRVPPESTTDIETCAEEDDPPIETRTRVP